MFKWLKSLFWGKDLSDVVNSQVIVKVHGIRFRIKKCDPLSFFDGSQVMLAEYDTYKLKKEATVVPEVTKKVLENLKKHYTDVLIAGVVEPKLVRKQEQAIDGAIFVEYLFTEFDLAQELYMKIIEFTYGKKKFKPNLSRASS